MTQNNQILANTTSGVLQKFFTIFIMMFCVIAFTACSDDSKKEEQQEQTSDAVSTPSIEPKEIEGSDTDNQSITPDQNSQTDLGTVANNRALDDANQDSSSNTQGSIGTSNGGTTGASDGVNNPTASSSEPVGQQPSIQDPEIKTIKVGTSPDYKPLEFIQDGQLVGFEIDVANKIFAKMHYKVEFVQMPFYSLIAALQASKVDVVVSGMSITDERKEHVDFSLPYYNEANSIVFKKSAEKNKQGLFSGARVGVQNGSTQESLLKLMLPKYQDIKVEARESNPQIIEELRMDKIDCAIVLSSIAQELVRNDESFVMEKIVPDATSQKDFGTAFALPKNSPMVAQINEAIQDLVKTGEIEKLATKWNM